MSAPVDVLATIADRVKYYPDRPKEINAVALLADPHYDMLYAGDMLAGAEVVAELIAAASPFATFSCSEPTITVRTQDIARLRHALAHVQGIRA